MFPDYLSLVTKLAFTTVHSKALGKLMWELKENMEQVFVRNVEYIKQNKTSDIWSEVEIQTVKGDVHIAWLNARKQIIHFFKGQYTNWNPCYTSSSEILVITNNQIFQQFT